METAHLHVSDCFTSDRIEMRQRITHIEELVDKGGPEPSEYTAFSRWLDEIAADLRSGKMSAEDLAELRAAFGPALSIETMQGYSFTKPRGYPGDYEIIDRIYRGQVTVNPKLRNWDLYCHAQSAPAAVRNRKVYFIHLLNRLEATTGGQEPIPVLNVASGPCRDLFEFFSCNAKKEHRVRLDCVDSDAAAIDFARNLCAPHRDSIRFIQANALRFTSEQRYRLVWSAGLFDYLGDRGFKFLLKHLLTMLRDDGELVIGNFAKGNPTRSYMEIVTDWHLHHRSAEDLVKIAESCGVSEPDIRIGREAEGVNLFLHIKRGARFIDAG